MARGGKLGQYAEPRAAAYGENAANVRASRSRIAVPFHFRTSGGLAPCRSSASWARNVSWHAL